MGSGIQVDTNDVSRAALQIGIAAEAVGKADPGGDVVALSGVLRGGEAARRAGVLEDRWRRRFQGWARDARAQGRAMRQSAETYDRADADVVRGLLP